uniref:Regucalcin n=1 Tax=Lygus hesperus TaxID=30085 RepID=A0A146M9E2_LYGHE
MPPVVECLKIAPLKLGEGPHWKADSQCLYMVDAAGSIVMHEPKTGKTVINILGERCNFIIPVKGKDNEFLVGSKKDVMHIEWDFVTNKILKQDKLLTLDDDVPSTRINDAKCDAKGRLWFGTLSEKFMEGATEGSFYSFSKKEGLVKHLSNIGLSNGLGFSPDNKNMYFIDSTSYKVDQYDLDITKGTIKFKKTVIDFKKANLSGMPDGMTVDSTGKLWIACILGSQVIQVDPDTGKILQRIKFDKSNSVTSLTFGGNFLNELFVTSANIPEMTINSPEAGCTFRVTDHGATGLLANEFDFEFA